MTSTSTNNVFLIGPGYIGREVIDRLLESNYNVTALVRKPEAAQALEKDGINTIPGTLDDAAIITQQAVKSDIIFHTATADHLPSVQAVIAGIDERASKGLQTIYIHTSGCSYLSDDSKGEYKSDTIYSDKKPAVLDALPDSAHHREIDLAILKARKRLGTKAKLFIVLPPLIYGATDHGRLSIQIPTMARFALKHKYAGYAGKGKAVWGVVHVRDLSYGYLRILQWLEEGTPEQALEHPYFFGESGEEVSWSDVATFIGEGLHAAGKITDPAPLEVPESQYGDLFGPFSLLIIGQNARNRAERLRDLGWQPKERSVRESFRKEELPILLKET